MHAMLFGQTFLGEGTQQLLVDEALSGLLVGGRHTKSGIQC